MNGYQQTFNAKSSVHNKNGYEIHRNHYGDDGLSINIETINIPINKNVDKDC